MDMDTKGVVKTKQKFLSQWNRNNFYCDIVQNIFASFFLLEFSNNGSRLVDFEDLDKIFELQNIEKIDSFHLESFKMIIRFRCQS